MFFDYFVKRSLSKNAIFGNFVISSKSIQCFTLNITSLRSCKVSITIYKTTRSNVQKETKLQHTHCENFESCNESSSSVARHRNIRSPPPLPDMGVILVILQQHSHSITIKEVSKKNSI
jgi:hypothetical protein